MVTPHALAAVLGQQGRMDVDDATWIGINQEVGHQWQESRQHNKVDGTVAQQRHHEAGIVQLGFRSHSRLDTEVTGTNQGIGIRLVADHQGTADLLAVGKILDEVLTVRAAARHEDGDVNLFHIKCLVLLIVSLSIAERRIGRYPTPVSIYNRPSAPVARQVPTSRSLHRARGASARA